MKTELDEIRARRRSAEHRYSLSRLKDGLDQRVRRSWVRWYEALSFVGGPQSAAGEASVEAALTSLKGLERVAGPAALDPGEVRPANVRPADVRLWVGSFVYGLASPGHPSRAAEWAWRAARSGGLDFAGGSDSAGGCDSGPALSAASRECVYGAMLFAATTAVGYVARDVLEAAYAGCGEIPDDSELSDLLKSALRSLRTGAAWKDALSEVAGDLHSAEPERKARAQICAAWLALLYGKGSLWETVERLRDADADVLPFAAAAGAILGVIDTVQAGSLAEDVGSPAGHADMEASVTAPGFGRLTLADLASRVSERMVRNSG